MSDFRRYFLPYCLERQKDGRYLVLNRQYNPVGFLGQNASEFREQPVAVKLKITPRTAMKISHKGSGDLDAIYLYDDGSSPVSSARNMNAYLDRLKYLAKLKTS